MDEAVNKLGYSDYRSIKSHLIETLSNTDIRKTNTFDMIMNGIPRKERESVMQFGFRVLEITRTALSEIPNVDMQAAQCFVKSLNDKELEIQLAGFINKDCKFEEILEKATIINNSRRNYNSPAQRQGGRMGNYRSQNSYQKPKYAESIEQ